jgi:hypothetical protein
MAISPEAPLLVNLQDYRFIALEIVPTVDGMGPATLAVGF